MENSSFHLSTNAYLSLERAHSSLDLRALLLPWLRFRAVITFKASPQRGTGVATKKVFYGDEHGVTYKQCLTGHANTGGKNTAKVILLDRYKGYNALVNKIEGDLRGQYIKILLFGRDGSNEFNILHRAYYNNRLNKETVNDPILAPSEQYKELHFKVANCRLVIFEPTVISSAQTDGHNDNFF
jgi:hypothetical protein